MCKLTLTDNVRSKIPIASHNYSPGRPGAFINRNRISPRSNVPRGVGGEEKKINDYIFRPLAFLFSIRRGRFFFSIKCTHTREFDKNLENNNNFSVKGRIPRRVFDNNNSIRALKIITVFVF